jgi:predicted dehydrogenase
LEEAFTLARQRLERCASENQFTSTTSFARKPVRLSLGKPRTPGGAVLFGWGHYARTCIVPSVEPHLPIASIHEIEAASIPQEPGIYRWSTSPGPDPEDRSASAWFLAGYHHHHTSLAVQALERGIPAVVEKPLVTHREDLARLLDVRATHPDVPLFIGFHRRHILGSFVRRDLGVGDDSSPLHCHAIVHEIPLPEHHWYNWPESGSRLLANGSHWIDHFLWLNPGSGVEHARARRMRSGQLLVELELENDACFSLTLSDHGTSRGGVRELTEWHRGAHTARLIDQSYRFEREDRVVHEAHLDEAQVYRVMYGEFCRAILANEPGETPEELGRTWEVMIALEESLAR